jgi:hypothetical protein
LTFQRSPQPPTANHGVCDESRGAPGIADLGKSLSLKHIDANLNAKTPTSAAKGELRTLARAAPALPLSECHQGVATFSDQVLAGVGHNRAQVSHAARSQSCQRGAIRRVATLIFGHFRARLRRQRDAMAANEASPSTQ